MRTGRLVLVTGPSGVGKDAVIGFARARLDGRDDVLFPRRIITRPADATETPDTMDDARFDRAEADGHFLVAWRAHGLSYALPASMAQDIAQGRQLVANVSRGIVAELRVRFPCCVVGIEADADLRRARLATRGRETAEAIDGRLKRAMPATCLPDISIRNEGELAEAGERLIALIEDWRRA
ncbi:MAG: phosphonate metabolism protein/1,5-bisphosphokinase (PRPP-forming) PhnN [Gluconacetobacter liquefaciens]